MVQVKISISVLETDGPLAFHMEIIVFGADTSEETVDTLNRTTVMFAGGRKTFFRAWPKVVTERNFGTKKPQHKGYARFTVFEEAGDWTNMPDTSIKIPGLYAI